MKKLLLSLAMAVGMVSVAGAVEVTDVLNQEAVGNKGTSYSDYTLAAEKQIQERHMRYSVPETRGQSSSVQKTTTRVWSQPLLAAL